MNNGNYTIELSGHELDLIWDALGMLIEHPEWKREEDNIKTLRDKVNQDDFQS